MPKECEQPNTKPLRFMTAYRKQWSQFSVKSE